MFQVSNSILKDIFHYTCLCKKCNVLVPFSTLVLNSQYGIGEQMVMKIMV